VRPGWGVRGGRDDEGHDGEGREGDQRHVVACDVALSSDPSRCMVSTEPKSSIYNQLDKVSRYTDESNQEVKKYYQVYLL